MPNRTVGKVTRGVRYKDIRIHKRVYNEKDEREREKGGGQIQRLRQ